MIGPRFSIDSDKVTRYLLDLTSKRGASKAKFSLGRGFDRERWMSFASALADHGSTHWPGASIATEFGEKHVVVGPLLCPDGSMPGGQAVWMLTPDSTTANFVTAYPAP